MPNATALRRGDVAPARFGPASGNDIRQATARERAMCSAWADAFGIWATAVEPYNSQMIRRKGKVNRSRSAGLAMLPKARPFSPIPTDGCSCLRRWQPAQRQTDLRFALYLTICPEPVCHL